MRAVLPCILITLCLTGSVRGEVEWPGLRGPGFDGAIRNARLFSGGDAGLHLAWKRKLGSGYSATAIGDGRVFTMFAAGDDDVLAAFDIESGDEIWRYRIGETYAGHDGSHDGPISTPALGSNRVFGVGPWGHLFAVDATTGEQIWAAHLVDDHAAKKPHYGFTSSPLLIDDVLVVEIGAGDGKTVAGFDAASGKLIWSVGDDTIEYQSPIAVTIGEQRQIMAVGIKNLYGIDAASGKVLWSYEHAGDERAMGGATIIPVPAGENRFLLMNTIDSSVLLQVDKKKRKYEITELWTSSAIKSSYVTPVYHDGYFYGMSGRIFTCIDAATGETRWRSREPGDGFPTLIGNYLVIVTKPGTLHVAEASPQAYREVARLDLFDEHAWSEVSYADGHLFARSMGHLARIDPGVVIEAGSAGSWVDRTEFGKFLDAIESATDKSAVIEQFFANHESLPMIEGRDTVHFVYRGDATDVGIIGDMIGYRREDPMTRIPGTDLFHYSTRLEPDAAVTYGFITDFGDPVADPRNPHPGKGLFGDVSWFAMPGRRVPDYLGEAPSERRGKLTTVEWDSAVREGQHREAAVYLPAGYDRRGSGRYPSVYIHGGKAAIEEGAMKNALDHLIGSSVEPLIAVFVYADEENPRGDLGNAEKYNEMIVDELIPLIDEKFATIAEAAARATIGHGRSARVALLGAAEQPSVFGAVGIQSALAGPDDIEELLPSADEQPMTIYMNWGRYHMRSPHEAWDVGDENRKLWEMLRERGYRPAGGELPEGYGWACWRAHTDAMLAALFPFPRE